MNLCLRVQFIENADMIKQHEYLEDITKNIGSGSPTRRHKFFEAFIT